MKRLILAALGYFAYRAWQKEKTPEKQAPVAGKPRKPGNSRSA